MDRTERFYKLQSMLLSQPSVKLHEMQEALEVSRATLYRDLNYMRDRLGMPFDYQAALRGYAMTQQTSSTKRSELPGIWFTQQELYSLLTMIELISNLQLGSSLLSYLAPVKSRLEGLLDDGMACPTAAQQRIAIVPCAQRQVSSQHFQLITAALSQRKRLKTKYFSRRAGHTTERHLSPQRLVYYRDNWYLDAYCHLREGLRRFSLDAIASLSLTEQTAHDISATAWHESSVINYSIFNTTEQHIATLKFTPYKAQWVSRELWHPKQSGQQSADGSYLLNVPYRDDTDLIQDILAHGSDVQVLRPLALKEKVAEKIKKMMNVYT